MSINTDQPTREQMEAAIAVTDRLENPTHLIDCGAEGEETIGPLRMRKMKTLSKAGDSVEGHFHNYDHVTLCRRGPIRIREMRLRKVDGEFVPVGEAKTTILHPWDMYLVPANVSHEITALADDAEFWCIFSHRGPGGEITQEPKDIAAYF